MGAYATEFFLSWFRDYNLAGLGLALAFGAVWLVTYWPTPLKKPWVWLMMAATSLFTLASASFIQIPLQALTGELLAAVWGVEAVMGLILVSGIPQILLSGLVQEGAKLLPLVVYWWLQGRQVAPMQGLMLGAAGMWIVLKRRGRAPRF